MFRAFLFLAAFSLISPAIRNFFIDSLGAAQTAIEMHSIAACAGVGLLGFGSFLWIRLTSRH